MSHFQIKTNIEFVDMVYKLLKSKKGVFYLTAKKWTKKLFFRNCNFNVNLMVKIQSGVHSKND